jgi:TRAP-type transport system small permease protein
VSWRSGVLATVTGIEHAIDVACRVLLLVSGLSLLVLLNLAVVLRYVFERALGFAPDLTELLFAIFVMAGIAQAARLGVHVATQLLVNALQRRWRTGLVVFMHALTAVVYLLLAYYGVQNAIIANDQTSPVLHIPWSVGYGCLSAGLVLIAICSVAAIVRHTVGREQVKVDLADPGAGTV